MPGNLSSFHSNQSICLNTKPVITRTSEYGRLCRAEGMVGNKAQYNKSDNVHSDLFRFPNPLADWLFSSQAGTLSNSDLIHKMFLNLYPIATKVAHATGKGGVPSLQVCLINLLTEVFTSLATSTAFTPSEVFTSTWNEVDRQNAKKVTARKKS